MIPFHNAKYTRIKNLLFETNNGNSLAYGIKIFDIDESIRAFGKRDDYSSLFYTGNETAKFLKGLDMMNSDSDLDQALDVHFLEEIKAERK